MRISVHIELSNEIVEKMQAAIQTELPDLVMTYHNGVMTVEALPGKDDPFDPNMVTVLQMFYFDPRVTEINWVRHPYPQALN